MKKKLKIIVCALTGCIVAFLIYAICGNGKSVIDMRKSDVAMLTRLCLGSRSVRTTDELSQLVARKKIKLYSPIPKDRSKPCYRLVNPLNTDDSNFPFTPNELLIEETNVTDSNLVFASSMDGSIFAEPESLSTNGQGTDLR